MGVYSKSACTLFIGMTSVAYASCVMWTVSLLLSSVFKRASKTYQAKEKRDCEFFCFFCILLSSWPFTLLTSISMQSVQEPRALGPKSCFRVGKKIGSCLKVFLNIVKA